MDVASEGGQPVQAARVEAALASRGGSSDEIHDWFARTVEALELAGDLLDFGAGVGRLGARLQATGRFHSVTAMDLVLYPQRAAQLAWIRADLNERLPCRDASFDVVVASEVIEHLENPRALAREWARILRPGGVLLLSTPNNESVRSLISLAVRGCHVAFADSCYPAHITALVRKDLERILQEAGFSRPAFSFPTQGVVPGVTRWRWPRLAWGLLSGVRFCDNLFVVARRAR